MDEIRPLAEADLSAVARRLAAEYPADGMTVANIGHKVWGDDHYEADLNLGAWRDGRLTGVLLGVARSGRAWIKALTVRPDPAVAEALLAAFEDSLRHRCITTIDVSGSAPFYFLPGVDATDAQAVCFYTAHGFRKANDSYNMACDLLHQSLDTSAAEADLATHGYRCARLTPADAGALATFLGNWFSPGWATETLEALGNQPVSAHVAWQRKRVVGFAAAEVTNPGWFGPTGVHPRHRGRGLGRVLLLRALADLRDLGYRRAEIGWVGPLAWYARHCGASVSRVFWMYRKELAPETGRAS